jgi:hypothetical protein
MQVALSGIMDVGTKGSMMLVLAELDGLNRALCILMLKLRLGYLAIEELLVSG